MGSSVLIRNGELSDAQAVQEMAAPIMESYGLVPDFDQLDFELGHFGEPYDGAVAQFVACLSGRVIGSAILKNYDTGVAKLTGFYVSGAHRGKGVGKRLLAAVIQTACESGYKAIYLETWDKMEAATELYKKLGWKKVKDLNPQSGAERGYSLELTG